MISGSYHRLEDGIDRNRGEGAGIIGHGVGDDQLAVMDESAATADDVGHVALALVGFGFQQGLFEAADQPDERDHPHFLGTGEWVARSNPWYRRVGGPIQSYHDNSFV